MSVRKDSNPDLNLNSPLLVNTESRVETNTIDDGYGEGNPTEDSFGCCHKSFCIPRFKPQRLLLLFDAYLGMYAIPAEPDSLSFHLFYVHFIFFCFVSFITSSKLLDLL